MQYASLKNFDKSDMTVQVINEQSLMITRGDREGKEQILILLNFAEDQVDYRCPDNIKKGSKIIDSRESRWSGQEVKSLLYPDQIASGHSISLPPLSVGVYMC